MDAARFEAKNAHEDPEQYLQAATSKVSEAYDKTLAAAPNEQVRRLVESRLAGPRQRPMSMSKLSISTSGKI